jgi:hypothetical protein
LTVGCILPTPNFRSYFLTDQMPSWVRFLYMLQFTKRPLAEFAKFSLGHTKRLF